MQFSVLTIHGFDFAVQDYRNLVDDYRILNKVSTWEDKPDFIPSVDKEFFAWQDHSLPVVKIDEQTYLFPTKAKNVKRHSTISDYLDYCLVDLDIFIATQNYYYTLAKLEYEKNPAFRSRFYFSEGALMTKQYEIKFRKRGSNMMSRVQYNLAAFIHGEKSMWQSHKELQDEIKYKQTDLKLQLEELESPFTKGEYASYGQSNLNDKLLEKYGVKTKLQNGNKIKEDEISTIEHGLALFFSSVKSIAHLFKEFNMIISYSRQKHMHGRNFIGIFHPYFQAIGVSDLGNFNSTLSHEIGHFIDYYLGNKIKRHYSSDDKNHIAGQIAYSFRKNMLKRQSSEYKNRSKECFARAIEQFFCLKNAIPIPENSTDYCENGVFTDKIEPLILNLLEEIDVYK